MSRWGAMVLVLLATVAAPRPARTLRPFRVITYNLHLGEALKDERSGGDRSIARTLRNDDQLAGVQILAVQELCAGEGGWQLKYLQRFMAEDGPVYTALAYVDPSHQSPDPNIGPPCDRAEAILSRYPIVASGTIDLPPVREPRSAVWADLDLPARDGGPRTRLRVYNVHLENRVKKGSAEEGRLRQIQVVLTHLQAWRAEHPEAPVLLLGDFNSTAHPWNPFYREHALQEIQRQGLQPTLTELNRTLTWLPYQIDWIFFSGLQLLDSRVVQIWLSDHFPVVADFTWPTSTNNGH